MTSAQSSASTEYAVSACSVAYLLPGEARRMRNGPTNVDGVIVRHEPVGPGAGTGSTLVARDM